MAKVQKSTDSSSLAEVVDRILCKYRGRSSIYKLTALLKARESQIQ